MPDLEQVGMAVASLVKSLGKGEELYVYRDFVDGDYVAGIANIKGRALAVVRFASSKGFADSIVALAAKERKEAAEGG